MKNSNELLKVSQVEDLHNFYSIERNLNRAIMRLEWASSNLDDLYNGRTEKIIDINYSNELKLFFDWMRFDKTAQSYYNKTVLHQHNLRISVWFDLNDLTPDMVENIDARDQTKSLLKIHPEISKWLEVNFDSNKRNNQPQYFLYAQIKKNSLQLKNQPTISFPEIFTEGGYDLFSYLNNNFNSENKSPKAKYSVLFHYLKYEQYIVGSQLDYIRFIKDKFGVSLSKIQRLPQKYDSIKSTLGKLKASFLAFNQK